jgi:4-aminobutyrate aminotransferase-like enzyme
MRIERNETEGTAPRDLLVRSPFDQKVHLKTAVPGPVSIALRKREDAHIAPGLQGYALMAGVVVDHAVGSAVTDVDGNTLLDFIGGIGVGGLGHAHPRVVEAIQRQVARAHIGSFTSEARVDLVERLAAHAPTPGLHRVQLYSGGAEAIESALRLAKSHTKKWEFVSFWGGFHGKTLGALGLMGSTYKEGLGPMAPGAHLVPYADCYRCPIGSTYPACGLGCVEVGRKQLKTAGAGAVAAFVVEPMQGTAGNIIPPDDFLPAVRSVAREHDALLIADEMITGFGRTGTYWGIDHSGVVPDIVTLGKSFGGGFPLSGLVTRDDVAAAKPWSATSGSSSSYGGNPLGAAAGAAALAAIDDERLVDNARVVGAALLDALRSFVDDYPFVGDVRGRGLFLGMELVRDKKTKQPLSRNVTRRIFDECVRRGLLTMAYAPSFRLQPALTIDRATAMNGVAVLREVFDRVKEGRLWLESGEGAPR